MGQNNSIYLHNHNQDNLNDNGFELMFLRILKRMYYPTTDS